MSFSLVHALPSIVYLSVTVMDQKEEKGICGDDMRVDRKKTEE
jgi:hypothetical protein